MKARECVILPRNPFVLFDNLTFRLEWRYDRRSLYSSTIYPNTVLRLTGHFDVVLIIGPVQKPIRVGGRDQIDRLVVKAVHRRR